jgi:hypothetical protein
MCSRWARATRSGLCRRLRKSWHRSCRRPGPTPAPARARAPAARLMAAEARKGLHCTPTLGSCRPSHPSTVASSQRSVAPCSTFGSRRRLRTAPAPVAAHNARRCFSSVQTEQNDCDRDARTRPPPPAQIPKHVGAPLAFGSASHCGARWAPPLLTAVGGSSASSSAARAHSGRIGATPAVPRRRARRERLRRPPAASWRVTEACVCCPRALSCAARSRRAEADGAAGILTCAR